VPVEAKSGESVVVALPLALPAIAHDDEDRDRSEEKAEPVKPAPASDPAPPTTITSPASPKSPKSAKQRRVPKGLRRSVSPKPSLVNSEPPKEVEMRSRDAQISLSVSQTSRDKEPIVSVSFGWSGREQTQRTFEAPSE